MLTNIVLVTLLVHHLSAVESPYHDYLGYTSVSRGAVSPGQAGSWAAPAMTGHPFVILEPASGKRVYLRFIEDPGATEPAPGTTFGWNATEILVQDPDALAQRLENSPFQVVGQPRDLYPAKDAPRAMQVLGPAGELLYFSRVIPSAFRLPMTPAGTPVDRIFIVVAGGPSMDSLREFYTRALGLPVSEPTPFPISVLSRANGLPTGSKFPLATASLPADYLVELDEYPSVAKPRAVAPGSLPPGMAMVTFAVPELADLTAAWRSPPSAIAEFPYDGHQTAVTVGPAGEWIEVIESPATRSAPGVGQGD